MTLIEALVGLGVISFLLALLLPAIQSTRLQAIRIECSDRLKQIMTATSAFEANYQHFPEYSSGGTDEYGRRHWNVCPLVEILPYLDQVNLFQQIDRERWRGSYGAFAGRQLLSGQNAEFTNVTIPVYQCPADRQVPGSCNYRVNLGTGADWFPRPSECYDPKSGNGAFREMKALSARDFKDGLSNTVFYSERVIGDGDHSHFDPWRDYSHVVDGWPTCTADELRTTCQNIAGIADKYASFAGHTWLFPSKSHTAYDHIMTPNSRIPDCAHATDTTPSTGNSAISARSQHPGGVNVVMGDASIKWISENIGLNVWRQLGSRDGRDE